MPDAPFSDREPGRPAAPAPPVPLPRGATLDRLVRLAAWLFGTPVAAVSLVADGRQRVLAAVGTDARDLDADGSPCAAVVRAGQGLAPPDPALAALLAGGAAPLGVAGARFYAGAPLVAVDGRALGTLAVVDRRARGAPDPSALAALADLAHLAAEMLAPVSPNVAADGDTLGPWRLLSGAAALADLDLAPDEMLTRAVALVGPGLDVDWGGLVALAGDRASALDVWRGPHGEGFARAAERVAHRAEGGLMWGTARLGTAVFVDDYVAHPDAHPLVVEAGARSVASAFLGRQGGVDYVMTLVRTERGLPWSDRDRLVVEAVVRAVRAAVEQGEERRARHRAEALLAVSRALDAEHDLADVADAALAALERALGHGWVVLWLRAGDVFRPLARRGTWPSTVVERQRRGAPAERFERYGVLAGRAAFLTTDRLPEDSVRDGIRGAALLPVFLDPRGRDIVLGAYRSGAFEAWSPVEEELLRGAARIFTAAVGRRKQREQLEAAAATDGLTGLGNRRAFEGDLAAALAAGDDAGSTVAVLTVDLDGLKGVNDREGHARGDALLRTFAGALRDHLPHEGRAYRLGGDEFVAILPRVGIEGEGAVRAALAGAIEATRAAGFPIGASAGLASFPTEARVAAELVALSDARMYSDKASRRAARGGA